MRPGWLRLAQRLISDGERVLDVPSKLSTRVRAIDSGHGRKNDPADASAVAVVELGTNGLREVVADDQSVALRLLSERRRDLVRSRTQAVNRLHQVLMELIPAGAQRHLTAAKAKDLVATVRPRDVAGMARRQLAVVLIDDVAVFDRKIKAVDARIEEAVAASGTHLTDIVGVGPVTAATILEELGDVVRFATADNFASCTGTAPIETSSGELEASGGRRLVLGGVSQGRAQVRQRRAGCDRRTPAGAQHGTGPLLDAVEHAAWGRHGEVWHGGGGDPGVDPGGGADDVGGGCGPRGRCSGRRIAGGPRPSRGGL